MTNVEQRHLEILQTLLCEKLERLLDSSACLSSLREAQKKISRNYRDFTVWGPDLVESGLLVTIYHGSQEHRQETRLEIGVSKEWRKRELGV